MATSACHPHTIHASPTVDIQYCPDCQMLHLTLGAITVRMTDEHFSQFAKDLSEGLFQFNAMVKTPTAVRMLM